MSRGNILLADDERTFAESTADLLRRDGYTCETVGDGAAARARVAAGPIDLLIADLEMPGNAELELVREVGAANGGLPIIILTGYPSVRSAVACIELPVAAYLVKPVDYARLAAHVATAVARFRSYRAMQDTERRLGEWRTQFEQGTGPRGQGGADAFLSLALRNVMGSLTDLEQLGRALAGQPVANNPCQLMNCPRGAQLMEAVRETIDVLEATKHAFKSKQLGELRAKLELLLDHN